MKSISSKMVVYNYNTANKLFEKSNNQLESEPILDLPFQLKKENYREAKGQKEASMNKFVSENNNLKLKNNIYNSF